MSAIWKRLQRINKRATKFRITVELQELMVEGTKEWQPNKLSVVFNRRKRRVISHPKSWEPNILNPYRGLVIWPLAEVLDFDITLYRGAKNTSYEEKCWRLSIEDLSVMGRLRRIATVDVDISKIVDKDIMAPTVHEFFKFTVPCVSKKVKDVYITFMMKTQFLREGKAT